MGVIEDLTEHNRIEQRLQRLNLILRTIRNVDQVILDGEDRDRLIKGICSSLVKTRGYFNAWIALFGESGRSATFAEAGLEAEVLAVVDDPAESQTIIDDYFTANPDTDTFLTLGPNSANPFYAFMEAAGLGAGDVHHGTFDLDAEIEAKIKDGTTLFGIDQQPYMQGFGSIWVLSLVGRLGLMPASPVTPPPPPVAEMTRLLSDGVIVMLAPGTRPTSSDNPFRLRTTCPNAIFSPLIVKFAIFSAVIA